VRDEIVGIWYSKSVFQADPGASSRAECHHGSPVSTSRKLVVFTRLSTPSVFLAMQRRHNGGTYLIHLVPQYCSLAPRALPLGFFLVPFFLISPSLELLSRALFLISPLPWIFVGILQAGPKPFRPGFKRISHRRSVSFDPASRGSELIPSPSTANSCFLHSTSFT